MFGSVAKRKSFKIDRFSISSSMLSLSQESTNKVRNLTETYSGSKQARYQNKYPRSKYQTKPFNEDSKQD